MPDRQYTYQKPVPSESIYKHLKMLYNFCIEQADTDFMPVRAEMFRRVAAGIARVAEGRACRKLQEFGE